MIRWDAEQILDQVKSVCNKTESGCWIWAYNDWAYDPTSTSRMYPRIMISGARRRVSHWVLKASGYDRPSGTEACHSCDNPPCCNPDHLRWDTHKNNMIDMGVRGRSNFQRYPDNVRRGDRRLPRSGSGNFRTAPRTGNYSSGDGHWTRKSSELITWRGTDHHSSVLDDNLVKTIKDMYSSGIGPTAISRTMNVSRGAVRGVLEGRTWTHIE